MLKTAVNTVSDKNVLLMHRILQERIVSNINEYF